MRNACVRSCVSNTYFCAYNNGIPVRGFSYECNLFFLLLTSTVYGISRHFDWEKRDVAIFGENRNYLVRNGK